MRQPRLCWPWGTRRRCETPRPSRRFVPFSPAESPTRPPRHEARRTATGLAMSMRFMGSKINPSVIDAFVVCAVIFTIVGVLLFCGGKFFKKKFTYVIYFDGSVQGLNVGAPLIFW